VHASGAVITVDLTMDEVTRFSKDKNDDLQTQLKDVAAILCSALKEFRGNQRTGSITATAAVPVPPTFDARFSCLWKRYVYCISCGHQNRRSPFLGRFAWQLDQSLDIDSMLCAARVLNGKHNFQWLSKVQKGELRSPIKTLGLTLEKMEGSMFQNDGTTILKVSGTCDFFLYNMMRRIVGVLVSIGQNQATLSALESYLKIQDEEMDGDGQSTCKVKVPPGLLQTAPANGLCLEHIEYDVQIWEEMEHTVT
jgi:tRNA pseudouridine38-40 synthase